MINNRVQSKFKEIQSFLYYQAEMHSIFVWRVIMAYKNIEDKKRYDKQYYIDNNEKKKEYNKQYYIDNKGKILEKIKQNCDNKKEYDKKHYKKNRKKYNENTKKWRKNNKEKQKENDRQYYIKNREKILKASKQWYENNRRKKIQSLNLKRRIDLKSNINSKIASGIRKALRGNKAGRKWETLVGYTLNELIKRLKKTIPKGYCWNDYLNGKFHIDHIIPISVFNYTKPEHPDFKRCWALKNLRLLPVKENLIKNAKITKPFQPALKILKEEE